MRTSSIKYVFFLLAILVGFSTSYAEDDEGDLRVFADNVISKGQVFRGSFTPDGNSFYFFRKVGNPEDYRIYRSDKVDAVWQEPVQIDLGGDYSDLYPDISADGKRMVFASYRPFPGSNPEKPQSNIWITEREGDGWGVPRPLVGLGALENYKSGPRFNEKGEILFESSLPDFSGKAFYIARPTAEKDIYYVEADTMVKDFQKTLENQRLNRVRLSADGRLLFFNIIEKDPASDRYLPADYWVSVKTEQGWSEMLPLEGGVNTKYYENFLVITPDGKDIIFVRGFRKFFTISLKKALPKAIADIYYKDM